MKRILVIASLIFSLGMGLMACSDDDGATCSSALNNFYDQGCSMFVDGDQLSRQEAIEGCKDSSSFYHDCGCGGVFQNVLDCFEKVGQEQCNVCDTELQTFEDCYNSNCI